MDVTIHLRRFEQVLFFFAQQRRSVRCLGRRAETEKVGLFGPLDPV